MNYFENCKYFKVGDSVVLSHRASSFTCNNKTTPQYVADRLKIGNKYTISDVTPIMKVSGGDQQFVSIDDMDTSYPCWCFDLN